MYAGVLFCMAELFYVPNERDMDPRATFDTKAMARYSESALQLPCGASEAWLDAGMWVVGEEQPTAGCLAPREGP